jgi:hypothetical protein
VTTGCNCRTPGCAGISYDPGGKCGRCEIDAMPPGTGRTLRQIIYTALNGCEPRTGEPSAARGDREAGS